VTRRATAMPRHTPTTARFEARARARRWAPWRRAAILVLVLAVIGAIVWLIWWSPVLVVRSVRVEGASGAQAGEVTTVAQVPVGQPMARVDLDAVTRRVRAKVEIAEARASRSWPNTVVIAVKPRVPVLALKNPQGELQVVDATGVAFGTVAEAPAGVPMVTASSAAGTTQDAIKSALSVVSTLPPDLAAQVSTLTVATASSVTFTLAGIQVTWGGADQPELKVKVLRTLMQTHPAAIDVSAPDSPVTRDG